ncbi:MAG: NADH-quinone oxidoreductase subunit J [Desulfobacteraceae bacterium]|jgi:NADH-quinone oxidoreductase subunit J
MTLLSILFYLIAALILGATVAAVTRRNMVYAVIYLVLSFFGTAMLFYLLGAPFLAALEVIIYAGAIMVLFLFIIMMIHTEEKPGTFFPSRQLLPALALGGVYLAAFAILVGADAAAWRPLVAAQALPGRFGAYLFENHWLSIEIASALLLAALIGALVLGRRIRRQEEAAAKEEP